MSDYLYAALVVIGLAIAIVLIILGKRNEKKKVRQLKAEYDSALKNTDKKVALEAGRKYYGAMRSNKLLTIYDEQAIANDLNSMQ